MAQTMSLRAAAAVFATLGLLTPAAAIEEPPTASAAVILGPLAKGSNYTVDEVVHSDGFMRLFIFETPYGRYRVDGLDLAKAFIQELNAVTALDKMSTSEIFANSLGKAVTAPVRYGVDLIQNPSETLNRSFSGVTNMFGRVRASLENQQGARTSAADGLLGIDDKRREFATSLHVDPYTRFPPLANKLTEVATAAAAGGLTVKAALAFVPGGAGIAVSSVNTAEDARETLRDKTSSQVLAQVKETLQKLKVPSKTVARLIGNQNYTPADYLVMSLALERLNAANTTLFIARAAEARSRDVAYFQRERAILLAKESQALGGIKSFISVGGFPLNKNAKGRIIAAFPFDDFSWTQVTSNIAAEVRAGMPATAGLKPVLATKGTVTPVAAAELENLGWELVRLR